MSCFGVYFVCAPSPQNRESSNLNCQLPMKRTHALHTITLSHFLFFPSIFSAAQQPSFLGDG